MNNKIKLFLVVSLILCFLVFLYLRRKRLQEDFECAKIDNSLFCIKDSGKIDKFRESMDPYYKPKVQDMDFFNYIDFKENDILQGGNKKNYNKDYIDTVSFRNFINNKKFGAYRLGVLKLLKEEEVKNLKFKYDYIHLDNPEIPSGDLRKGKERKK